VSRPALGAALAVAALAAACSPGHDELQEWMEQQRREVKPNVQPLSPPKSFDPQPYLALQQVEPFSNQKLSVALK
jgi:type IV pilus assembly protein PilP